MLLITSLETDAEYVFQALLPRARALRSNFFRSKGVWESSFSVIRDFSNAFGERDLSGYRLSSLCVRSNILTNIIQLSHSMSHLPLYMCNQEDRIQEPSRCSRDYDCGDCKPQDMIPKLLLSTVDGTKVILLRLLTLVTLMSRGGERESSTRCLTNGDTNMGHSPLSVTCIV